MSKATTKYPGKMLTCTSFNLTAYGRQLLTDFAAKLGVSQSDTLEELIRARQNAVIQNMSHLKKTHGAGGPACVFVGKNRGTTSALALTYTARKLLDEQTQAAGISRGDYIEYLLRSFAGETIDV